jgi:hypothetical protein
VEPAGKDRRDVGTRSGLVRRWRLSAIAFAAGLLVRLWALPFWGTFDTEIQKAWSGRAATVGLADIYGPSDRELIAQARSRGGPLLVQLATQPVHATTFEWGTARFRVDYPPGSLVELWAAGKLYSWYAPGLPNRSAANASINLFPLLGSIVIIALLYRSASGRTGTVRAMAFWLNPAVILASPVLGYQDTIFGAFALAAVLAMAAGRLATATALVVVAGLVKPQGALLLPTLAVVLVRAGVGTWLRAGLAGFATADVVLAPWWTQGYLLSAFDGCLRPLRQDFLSAFGFNLWWIAGYLMQWRQQGPWPITQMTSIDAFREWAGWDPRWVSRVLLGAATLANIALLARALKRIGAIANVPSSRKTWLIALSVIFEVHAYALLGTSVHENHTFLAVILVPLLLGAWAHGWALTMATSVFLFLNLFLCVGLGRRITTLHEVATWRGFSGLDLTVIVAAAHVAFVAVMAVWIARTMVEVRPQESAMLESSPE